VINSSRVFPAYWTTCGSGAGSAYSHGIVSDRSKSLLPDSISGNAMRLISAPNMLEVTVGQEFRAHGNREDIFLVGGWCNAVSVSSGFQDYEASIAVRFMGPSGSWGAWRHVKFSVQRSGWHYVCKGVKATSTYIRVQIAMNYSRNNNTAMFSHLFISRDAAGNSFVYDGNGNVTAVKDITNAQCAARYDSFDNLLSYVQPGGYSDEQYLFTYGTTDDEKQRHLPLTAETPCGVKTATEYDTYGNAISSTVQQDASGDFIRTETGYTDDGNYVRTQTDARGNTVTNEVDENGRVLSVTDPANKQVSYQYDASNRVTEVSALMGTKRVKNVYTYENDRIKTVAHNTTGVNCDVRYTFNYDSLGRKTSVTVSNGSTGATEQPLSTNIYSDDRKGRLEEVQYGNGGKVAYEYDDFDRVTDIKHDNAATPRFTTEYDAQGRVAKVTDTADGSTIASEYDLTDRPISSEQKDGNGNTVYRTHIKYDAKSRVSSFTEKTGVVEHKTEYTYDSDNRVTQVKYNNSNDTKIAYTYDRLNRITERKVTNGTQYNTAYSYVPGSVTNSTSPLIQSITQGSGENAINFSYTYDNCGNITSETRNGVTVTYEYDSIGQLIRVNDPNDKTAGETGTTWKYEYDRGGNILSKTAYAYTTSSDAGTPSRAWSYGYNDPNWKDKLTSFDGHTITYDAIGNPLNDGTWTYEWQAGRQLRSMTKTEAGDTITLEFTYNHAGLRTKKVKKVNGEVVETTEYIWNGKKVASLIKGADTMHFFYDEQSRVSMVDYNGTMYTYVHNLQGDVVGIVDENGSVIVEYKYNAWGRLITDTVVDSFQLNPFTYRGYIYDSETGLFYVCSRYFNCESSRFINADSFEISSKNKYAYAWNSPEMKTDFYGFDAIDVIDYGGSANSIGDLFDRISSRTGFDFHNNQGLFGDYEYHNFVVANDNSIEEILNGEAVAFVTGYITTLLISNPTIGGITGAALWLIDSYTTKTVESMFPNIPDGVYSLESVTYREENGVAYSYTYKLYFVEGTDVSGCDYYALWRETTTRTLFDYTFDSRVLAERTRY